MNRLLPVLLLFCCGLEVSAQERPDRRRPAHAVGGLETPADLHVSLFAAEPTIVSPTSLDVDHRGRVWVMEGYNYRPSENPQNPFREEGDRIVILEDTDGDGSADDQTIFYQGREIDAAMGLAVLGEKVIVSAYDTVFVFTDVDGDDRADSKEVLFQGFNEVVNDHSVHTFVAGPDGKLYFGMGNGASRVLDADGEPIVDLAGHEVTNDDGFYRQGMVFRVHPDGSQMEVLGDNFRNNYELAVDSYGTVWQSDNDDDGNRAVRINYVMEFGDFGFTDQRTGAGWRTTRTGMAEDIPSRHWHQNDPGVVPNLLITGAGSPTGLLVYEGVLLPERFHGELIHADAGPNVVRAYPKRVVGAGYTARIEQIVTGARDQWFRPTDVAAAPDGSIFIADWYDPVLGGHQAGDVVSGRIYRVAPPDSRYEPPSISYSSPEEAVEALKNPNLDARYRAWQRLFRWKGNAEPALSQLFEGAARENPRHRARALWLLSKLPERGDDWILEGLTDPDPNIRITAIRAARQRRDDSLLQYVEIVVRDEAAAVRREAAIALRYEDGADAAELWAELALQHDGEDRWYLEALGIGADRHWDPFFAAWRERVGDGWNTPGGRDIVWRSRADAALPLLAALIEDPDRPEQERLRYFRALDFHDAPLKQDILLSLVDGSHPAQQQIAVLALRHIDPRAVADDVRSNAIVDRALEAAAGTPAFVEIARKFDRRDRSGELLEIALRHSSENVGVEAAGLLVDFGELDRLTTAARGTNEQHAVAAVRLLGHLSGDETSEILRTIIMDEALSLPVRRAATTAYGDGFGIVRRLLDLVESGSLPDDLEPTARSILMNAYEETVRTEARRHFGDENSDMESKQPVRQLVAHEGDVEAGRVVFERSCAFCHLARGSRTAFGPDLSLIGDKLSKEGLYNSVLFPSAGVAFGFGGHVFRLQDGTELIGYVESETSDEVVVRLPGGISRRLRKVDISSRRKMEESLMPAALGQTMSQQDLIDLVEYLTTLTEEAFPSE